MPDTRTIDLRQEAWNAAVRNGVDPVIFVRQINQESGFNPKAVSSAGARGIAQIVPEWHPGVNTDDPVASLDYAANLMHSYVVKYNGRYDLALSAYNAGPGNVDIYGGVPPFAETQRYVSSILNTSNVAPSASGPAGADSTTAPQGLPSVGTRIAGLFPQTDLGPIGKKSTLTVGKVFLTVGVVGLMFVGVVLMVGSAPAAVAGKVIKKG